jgi:hypothetical protein
MKVVVSYILSLLSQCYNNSSDHSLGSIEVAFKYLGAYGPQDHDDIVDFDVRLVHTVVTRMIDCSTLTLTRYTAVETLDSQF